MIFQLQSRFVDTVVLRYTCPPIFFRAGKIIFPSVFIAMPPLAHRRTIFIVALSAMSLSGCAPELAGLRQSFAHPGPAAYQRAQAIQHDPYVLNDVGPEVVGGRPREYQIPVNEVERARLAAPRPAGLTSVPAPAVVVGPAPGPAPIYATAPATAAPPYPPTGAPIVTTPAPAAASYSVQQRPPY